MPFERCSKAVELGAQKAQRSKGVVTRLPGSDLMHREIALLQMIGAEELRDLFNKKCVPEVDERGSPSSIHIPTENDGLPNGEQT
jgi:hypothetical protein